MKKTSLGLEENIEALLSYLLGRLTGIVFLVIEKNSKFVRFHAMQSTITFLGFTILSVILGPFSYAPFFGYIPFVGILVSVIAWLIEIAAIITWIICLVKAYQGEKFKLPIVGDLAEKYTK